MNLAKIGLTGINAASHNLQTTGHNINNAATEGYNRQTVSISTAGGQSMGSGFIGRGVAVDTINRSYDGFLYRQLVRAESGGAALTAYGTEIAQLNNLFADRTVGISPALSKFFDSVDAVASAPADPAARSELLGRANSLAAQINDANAFIDAQRGDINTQLGTVVKQINTQVENIQQLNQRIVEARAGNPNHAPNDLLDQRDQALKELNKLVEVRVIEQDGSFSLTVGNGQMLLGASTVFPLQVVASAADPARLTVAYTAPVSGGGTKAVEMAETSLKGGTLGGLLQYRYEALDSAQNELGRLAVGLATRFNEVHGNGYTQNGEPGEDFFSVAQPKVIRAQGAQGTLTVGFADIDALTGHDYRVAYDGAEYVITDQTTGQERYRGDIANATSVDGLDFSSMSGATAGDSWTVQPTRNAAGSLKVELTDTSKIAAAGSAVGDTDGDNALELAKLRSAKTMGSGTLDFNEAYSRIVNSVAVHTQSNGTAAKAQLSLIQQNMAAQQEVSGVNLNEEYVNLMQYQEQFRAASRLIDVSSTLFDTLLSLKA